MAISLDKILTISAREWCESNGKSLKDYKMVGITSSGIIFSDCFSADAPKERLAQEVPGNAKIVTDYIPPSLVSSYDNILYEANATALIPKNIGGKKG